jgi:hypothetical protein
LTHNGIEKPKIPFAPPALETLSITANAIYGICFHGPAYKVLERVKVDGETAIGLMAGTLPPDTAPENAPST